MENNKDNKKTSRRDSFFVLCPVRVETLDGEISGVTMPTHELLINLKKNGNLPYVSDDEKRACEMLKRLITIQRTIDGLSV